MNDYRKELLWSHIYWLGVLKEAGSYTAAAQRLGVSKASMSLRITELEQASGVALVRRTTRSVRLTEAGAALVSQTRGAFEQIEQGFEGVRDLSDRPRGAVRISAPVALGRQRIVPLIAPFLREYPEIRIELDLSDHLSSLTREGFDLAIRHASTIPETYVAWLLTPTATILTAAPSYLQAHGMPSSPEALAEHNCLHYLRASTAPAWSFAPVQCPTERVSVAIRGNFSANNSEALRQLALDGQGIALLPDFSAQEDIHAGRLRHLMQNWKPVGAFGDAIYAIRPYSAYVPKAVRVLVQYLKKEMEVKAAGVFD